MISLFSLLFIHMNLGIYCNIRIIHVNINHTNLPKEMHIVIAHAQIAHKQPVWGIISRTGIVHRFLTGVDDAVGGIRRTGITIVGNPLKYDISAFRMINALSTSARSLPFSVIIMIALIDTGCDRISACFL